MLRSRSAVVRGVLAGLAGAATLALFFLIVDAARGSLLRTPTFLAAATFGAAEGSVSTGLIALYTLVHFAVFIALGVAVSWLLERGGLAPHFLLGAALGFLLFDLLFYSSLVVTGVDVVAALGWPEVLAGNIVAGIVMLGVLQLTAPEGTPTWRESLRMRPVVREGVIAGIAGATIVAAWFLFFDAVQGRLFHTPAALGSALLPAGQSAPTGAAGAAVIVAFTALHYAVFIGIGLIAATLAARAERHSYVLLGAALLFVTMEVFIIGMIALVASWLLDQIPWWSIAVANVLAAVVMGAYLWREHPALHDALAERSLEEPVRIQRPFTSAPHRAGEPR